MNFDVQKLGRIGFDDALKLQEDLAAKRRNDLIGDQLLLLEHDPVITLGSRARKENVLVSPDVLEREGIIIRSANRGGDVTYHGPGQLVGYLILKLPAEVRLSRLVWSIEEGLMLFLKGYGVGAGRKSGYPGLWIGEDKIAAIGLSLRGRVTMHGFSLNVSPRLEHFALINACGLGKGVTSIMKRGVEVTDWDDLEKRLASCLRRVFERYGL